MTWFTAEEIAQLTGWKKSYVLKRASLDKWVKRGTKPQQYSADSLIGSGVS